MRLCKFLVAVLAIASLAIGTAKADYRRINRYLISKVDSDEVAPNLAAASGLLNSVRGKQLSFLPGIPISDLKGFTALQQVVDDNKCDGSVDDILSANEATIRVERAYNPDGDLISSPARRVDKVVSKIIQDYAVRCEKVRLIEYHARKERLAKHLVEQVDNITETIMEGSRAGKDKASFYQAENLFHRYVGYFRVWSASSHEVFKSALMENARDDPGVKILQKRLDEVTGDEEVRRKIRQLVGQYLVEPCRRYVAELGPGLFAPARHSIRVFEDSRNKKPIMNDVDYYLGWSKFTICEQIVEDEGIVFNAVLRSVIGERWNGI